MIRELLLTKLNRNRSVIILTWDVWQMRMNRRMYGLRENGVHKYWRIQRTIFRSSLKTTRACNYADEPNPISSAYSNES